MSSRKPMSDFFIQDTIFNLRMVEMKRHSPLPAYALAGRAADIIEELLRILGGYDAYVKPAEEYIKRGENRNV